MLGLPEQVSACLFDLDGVLTDTARLHRQAWKQTFDQFLQAHHGAQFTPFSDDDYTHYVDGRPRIDGVRSFLAARGITLAEGDPGDTEDRDTLHGVGNRKNRLVLGLIEQSGVDPYPGSLRYVQAASAAGFDLGVVTSSANAAQVLRAAGLERFVGTRIDGIVIDRDRLAGKPAPDSFLAGAQALRVAPANTAVYEDALAGVAAGRAGGFGCVVGVDRAGQAEQFHAHGADVVVKDLAELLEAKQ